MEIQQFPSLINNSHHQYYQTETMEAASFDVQLAATLLGEDFPYPLSANSYGITSPQSQWDLNYDLVDQFISPPSYGSNSSGSLNGDNDDNNEMVLSYGGDQEPGSSKKRKVETKEQAVNGGTRTRKRHPSQVQDHILAERKRREILSHMFISLSTMIPGLKKMDKTSILGDAIKHMKQLQEKVKVLEKVAAQHDTVKSMVVVKKYRLTMDDDSDDNGDNGSSSTVDNISASGCGGGGSNDGSSNNNAIDLNNSISEIEVKILDNTLLLKVYCAKQKGVMTKLFALLDKRNMSVTNCSIIPFKNLALDITIVAQREEEGFDKDVKGFVRALRSLLRPASTGCRP